MLVWTDSYTIAESPTISYANRENVKPFYSFETISSSTRITRKFSILFNGRVLKLLNDFERLSENWNFEDELPPEKATIDKAKYFTQLMGNHGQQVFHTALGPNGDIMLDIRNKANTKSLELIFYPHKEVAVLFPNEGAPKQQPFNLSDLPLLLDWLNK